MDTGIPEISIVLPVYNGQELLPAAIKSILKQTFTDFELIVINDCSTDSSLAVALKFAEGDSRVKVYTNEKNLKLPASLNVGFRLARGRYHTWTSDDNILLPSFLQTLHKAIVGMAVDVVYSGYFMIDSQGKRTKEVDLPPLCNFFWRNSVGCSFMYKAQVFNVLNGYDESLFLVEDYDFWVRCIINRMSFYYLADKLYEYRWHESSLSSNNKVVGSELHITSMKRLLDMFVGDNEATAFSRHDAEIIIKDKRNEGDDLRRYRCLLQQIRSFNRESGYFCREELNDLIEAKLENS